MGGRLLRRQVKMNDTTNRPTLALSPDLFKLNRKRLLARLREKTSLRQKAVVILQGGKYHQRYGTLAEIAPFRQESYFYWLFGVTEPGFYGGICIDSGETVLFTEHFSESQIKRNGIPCSSQLVTKYGVDHVRWTYEISQFLESQNASTVLILEGFIKDGDLCTIPAQFEGIEKFTVDRITLFPLMTECRVHKSALEVDALRQAHRISSEAHKMVMQRIHPGMYEFQAESLYLHHCLYHGDMRHIGYPNFIGSGHTSAIGQYGRAWRPAHKQINDGDMCVLDLGAEYHCYCTDITTSFPANGKFSPDQKLVYEAVLNANRAVMTASKPGVRWPNMHLLGLRVLLGGLKAGGLVQGSIDDMMAAHIGCVFMPSGIGHLLGLDVADVGGYHPDEEQLEIGSAVLRTKKKLEPGMVITIEPGCFFIDELMDAAFQNPTQSPFLCKERIEHFRGTGGVRVEDTVVVIADGVENLVYVPRTVDEIENWMAERKHQGICDKK